MEQNHGADPVSDCSKQQYCHTQQSVDIWVRTWCIDLADETVLPTISYRGLCLLLLLTIDDNGSISMFKKIVKQIWRTVLDGLVWRRYATFEIQYDQRDVSFTPVILK